MGPAGWDRYSNWENSDYGALNLIDLLLIRPQMRQDLPS